MNNLIKYSLLAFLCINFSANGQNLKKIYTEVRNENMDNLLIELSDVKKDKNYNSKKTALFQIATCILYASEKSPIFNPIESSNLFKNIIITESDRESIFDFLKDYNLDLFKVSDLIYKGIYIEAKTNNTEDSYVKALEACGLCAYSEQIISSQTELAYNNVKSRKNIQDYKEFSDRYRNSKYDTEIKELIIEMEFENAKKSGNIELLNSFISIYPSHKLTNSAVELRDKWAVPSENATIEELSAYTAKYPLSKYLPAVLERIKILEKQKKAIKNDLTEEGLKGNVLSLTFSNFFEGDTNEHTRLTKYNTDGYKINIEDNNIGDTKYGYLNVSEKTEILRDTNNNKIEEKQINCHRKSGEAEKNYIWSRKYYYDGNSVTKKTSTMDEHDKVLSADDIIIKSIYDDKGRLISETQSQRIKNDEPYNTFIKIYKYENDLLVEEGDYSIKNFYKYDENKKLIFKRSEYYKGRSFETIYKYNDKGLLVEGIDKNVSDKTTRFTYYNYDENDFLIEEKEINIINGEEVTTYEYDEIGNWIKKILKCEKCESKTYTINRNIKYYSKND
jgi:hypothetical protein